MSNVVELKPKQEVHLVAVKRDFVDIIWPLSAPLIKMAVDSSNNEMDLDLLKEDLLDESKILINVMLNDKITASIILEQLTFASGKRVLNICCAGGANMDLWADKVTEAGIALCKDYRCEELYIIGRQGWVKFLKKKGYKLIHSTLSLKVDNKR